VRIFTGAPLPSGADAVVMQEDCTYDAGRVEISAAVQPGENLRVRGCVRTAGERIAEAGTRIGAAEVMALASVGCVQPLCRARPRVAVFSTGDELVPPQEIPGPYQLRDSNRMALEALVLQNGGDTVISACLPDDPEAVRRALRSGGECDLILTSGGVSVGDRDCIRPAVEELGEISLWRISIKPGKPLAFGSVGTALFMGLPGNPLSTIITFELFARPLLWALQGSTRFTRKRVQGTLAQPVAHRPGRTEYLAVRAEWHHNRWSFSPLGGRGSGDTAAMVGADALAVIPADAEDMPAGSHVEAILL
jgi:molybdopterin molybdotransferase